MVIILKNFFLLFALKAELSWEIDNKLIIFEVFLDMFEMYTKLMFVNFTLLKMTSCNHETLFCTIMSAPTLQLLILIYTFVPLY